MASIVAIDGDSVHRLHAGQVVLELQGAIKELVENSLDSGATSIDVRIKDHGLETIEVVDNGSGIAEVDWPFIGKKHHTSKLPELAALPHVTTFGFRGEALSSLCALCGSVTVTTATAETAPMGAIIRLGRDGSVLDSLERIARPRGTTVTLTGLFDPLPVRRKEFERTVKREFSKALGLLYAYALVPASTFKENDRPGVRLRVETIASGKGAKRTPMLNTDGRGSLRASTGAIWGPKALEGVLDTDLELAVEVDSVMARREGITDQTQTVKVSGLISTAAWGQGRTSPDRQFYYINGRPCELKQVARAVNEVYKTFNSHQVPLAILDFRIPPESVDINVSPDKRTIFLHSEANLITALKAALEDFFAPSRSAYALGGASSSNLKVETQTDLPFSQPVIDGDTEMGNETTLGDADSNDEEDDHQAASEGSDLSPGVLDEQLDDEAEQDLVLEDEVDQVANVGASRTRALRASRSAGMPKGGARSAQDQISEAVVSGPSRQRPVQQTLDTTFAVWSPDRKSKPSKMTIARTGKSAAKTLKRKLAGYASQANGARGNSMSSDEEEAEDEEDVVLVPPATIPVAAPSDDGLVEDNGEDELRNNHGEAAANGTVNEIVAEEGDDVVQPMVQTGRDPDGPIFDDRSDALIDDEDLPLRESPSPASKGKQRAQAAASDTEEPRSGPSRNLSRNGSGYRDEITSNAIQGEATLRFDMTRLKARYARSRRKSSAEAPSRDAFTALKDGRLADAAGIGNKDMARAEEALARVISKPDFERMEVLGQFNRGFIIARLRTPHDEVSGRKASDDLFIIDQHASDEKFNFETLQRTTVIKGQTLIKPRALQLTAGDEIVAMENLDVLRANGFEVKVDEDRAPGRGERVSLTAMPVSKETTFDFTDLEQLLHLLGDGSHSAGQMVRCSKARSMFAMRACRRSVMIGKPLSKSQMAQLLRNMGTIDQPWNCPHGRPTMRHLTRVERPTVPRSGKDRIDWSKWSAQAS